MARSRKQCSKAELEVLAVIVRRWAERRAWDDELCGMCARASAQLWRRLRRAGIKAMLGYAERHRNRSPCHVFVLCDGLVVDVTATQFGRDQIVIRRAGAAKQEAWFWRARHTFSDPIALNDHQVALGWPPEQRAARCR